MANVRIRCLIPLLAMLLPVAVMAQPAAASSANPASAPAGEAAAASARGAAEPRLLPGNDRVYAAPAESVALQGPPVDLRFEDTPVREVVHAILGDLLKLDYMVHPPADGRVTLVTSAQVTPDKAVFLLEAALQANGLVLARDARGVYHVGRPEALKAIAAGVRVYGGGTLPPGQGAIVVPLRYIGAAEMANILRPMVPPEAILRVDNLRNLLVLAGTRAQAEGWLSLVSTFDVDLLAGMSVGVFPLKHLTVRDVEVALQLVTQQQAAGGAPTAARPGGAAGAAANAAAAAAAAQSMPLFGAVRILPLEHLNSVIVVTARAAYLEEARRWIERLDRPGSSATEQRLYVYPVRNGSARHLGQVLGGIFGSSQSPGAVPSATGVAPGLSTAGGATTGGPRPTGTGTTTTGATLGINQQAATQTARGASAGQAVSNVPLEGSLRVVADEINNAILVYGTAAQYERIEDALRRLDVPPTQVLIEASIVEVTLTNETTYGLQWTFGDTRAGGGTGTSVLSTAAGGVLGGPLAGFSYTLRNSVGNVRAVLNAMAEKSLVRVISSPSLMVLDNHTAQIVVGNQQPIQTSETLSSEGTVRTTSIQYKDTGVALAVTPSVGAGDMVTMTINQAVTDVGSIDAATGQRAFLQRQFSSRVAVRSGEAVVLGGLIRENDTSGSSGVPGLSEIPVLGALFGTKTSDKNRTELLVVITPRVARTDADTRAISRELREKLRALEASPPLHTQPDPALQSPGGQQP
jgi:general secretion pathway protein D